MIALAPSGFPVLVDTPHGELHCIHGPATVDYDALGYWLAQGCRSPVPVRQGFAACLVRANHVVAAVATRMEVALFYSLSGTTLHISPRPRDLIMSLRQPPPLSITKLADMACLYDEPSTTVFEGIDRVPLGHALEWTTGELPQVRRWFDPTPSTERRYAARDAPRQMRAELRAAVAASLPESGPIAATLSGGLDSSIVVALAADLLSGAERHVFTATHVPLPGTADLSTRWEASDDRYARHFCAVTDGVSYTAIRNDVRVSPLQAVRGLFDESWYPMMNPANMVWISAIHDWARALGTSVVLTGTSGNATFSRSRGGLLHELVSDRRAAATLSQLSARLRAGEPLAAVLRAGGAALKTAVGGVSMPSGASPFAANLPYLPERASAAALDHVTTLDDRSPVIGDRWRRFVMRDASVALPWSLLPGPWWSDPFTDPSVIELALQLPTEAWMAGGLDRGLARAAAEGLVPDLVRLRTSRGAQAADVGYWYRGHIDEYEAVLEDMRRSATVRGFLDVERIARALAPGLPEGAEATFWEWTVGRGIGLGAFCTWYEERTDQVRRAQ